MPKLDPFGGDFMPYVLTDTFIVAYSYLADKLCMITKMRTQPAPMPYNGVSNRN